MRQPSMLLQKIGGIKITEFHFFFGLISDELRTCSLSCLIKFHFHSPAMGDKYLWRWFFFSDCFGRGIKNNNNNKL